MNEFELINKLFKPLVKESLISQDLSDDVAKISVAKDEELIVSKDIACENVHFLLKDGGYKIANKLLRCNLSDIASSGANPLFYMLGFSKKKIFDNVFISDFVSGLKDVQQQFNISLIGGDTISVKKNSDPLFFSITIFANAKKGRILSRKNAKEGDLIFVSGAIGDAFLGLSLIKNDEYIKKFNFTKKEQEYLVNRHYFPEPRIELGRQLIAQNLSSCAIDVSDGLLSDLHHICNSSNLSCEVYFEDIPTFFTKRIDYSNGKDLITKGDDYELIFSASKEKFTQIMTLKNTLKIDISCIGEFVKKKDSVDQITVFSNKFRHNIIEFSNFGYEH